MIKTHYIYLHGFASSPNSIKANYLRDCFFQSQISLTIPDLNQGNFSYLTLSRQIQQVVQEFPPSNDSISVTLIGSSFGGLTAAWLGEKYPQVQRLILLAPAFGFLSHWLARLGAESVKKWQETGELLVYHYGEKQVIPLDYSFVEDTSKYREEELKRPIPTLIFHGRKDETIPVEFSRDYARQRSWVELIELDSDHSLTDAMPEIWQVIQQVIQRHLR